MCALKIEGFDWDTGNIEKNPAKHGSTCAQIEERFLAIDRIGTRYAFVAFAIRIKDHRKLIRPISARFMHKKEIKNYEEEIKKDNN